MDTTNIRKDMVQRPMLNKEEFDFFRRICRAKGLDLCYFSPSISGSLKQIEKYAFEDDTVILLEKRRWDYLAVPYSVAEWQKGDWASNYEQIKTEFYSRTNALPGQSTPAPAVRGSLE